MTYEAAKIRFFGVAEIVYLCSVILLTNMEKIFLKIYCWYNYFCQYSHSHIDVFLAAGHTLLSIVILILYPSVYILEPSREVFYNLYFARVLLIAYLLFIWILPILSSIVVRIHLPYDKLIRMKAFTEIDDKLRATWNKRNFLWIFIRLMTYLLPYFLFIFLIAFFELVVNA